MSVGEYISDCLQKFEQARKSNRSGMSVREYILDRTQKFEQLQVKKSSWYKVSTLLEFMVDSRDEQHQYPRKKLEAKLIKMMQNFDGTCPIFETEGQFGSSEYPEYAAPQYLYFKIKNQK